MVHLRTSKRLFSGSSVSWVSVSFPGLLPAAGVPAAISSPLEGERGSRYTWEANEKNNHILRHGISHPR